MHKRAVRISEEMEDKGVIAPVVEPTDWVSPLAIVTKSGCLRVCMDPRLVSKYIKRKHF